MFFLEKHIGSSFYVKLSPGVLFEYFSVPLLKASHISFELYPNVLLCAFIKVVSLFGAGENLPLIRYRGMVITKQDQWQ
jgi:hypothetical protein